MKRWLEHKEDPGFGINLGRTCISHHIYVNTSLRLTLSRVRLTLIRIFLLRFTKANLKVNT